MTARINGSGYSQSPRAGHLNTLGEDNISSGMKTLNIKESADKSLRTRLMNGLLQAWYALKEYDPEMTGSVTAHDFRKALESAGLKFGTKEVDRILLFTSFTNDGKVDYKKLEDHVDNLINSIPSANPYTQDNLGENAFLIIPPATHRKEGLPDEEFREKTERFKQIVIANNKKISEAFIKYENNKLSMEEFLEAMKSLGLKPSQAVVKVLRRKEEIGSCSFTQLIQALSIPESKVNQFETSRGLRVNPVIHQTTSPVKDPPQEKPPRTRHLVNRPASLRDSNPVTWEDDPKKPRDTKKGTPSLITSAVYAPPPKISNQDPDLFFAKQEKINSIIRDFIDRTINSTMFRTTLKELGVEVNREIDRLIARNERDATVTFNEIHRAISLYNKGDLQYTFNKETVPVTSTQKSNLDFTWNDEQAAAAQASITAEASLRPPTATGKRLTETTPFACNWEEIPTRPSTGTPNRGRANKSTFTIALDPQPPSPPPAVRPKANITTFNPTDYHFSPEQKEVHTQTKVMVDKLETKINPVTWSNPSYRPGEPEEEEQSPLGIRRHFPRTDILNDQQKAPVHPIAPFGTARDTHYNVNPHHFHSGTRHPKA